MQSDNWVWSCDKRKIISRLRIIKRNFQRGGGLGCRDTGIQYVTGGAARSDIPTPPPAALLRHKLAVIDFPIGIKE